MMIFASGVKRMNNIIFPVNCPNECKYLIRCDMSIDDWTSICKKHDIQIDDCDSHGIGIRCLLTEAELEQACK